MRALSLRSWVLLLSLTPTLLIGILLGSYFTLHRFSELEENLIERGSDIIEPLAIASEYGMVHNSREMLKRLIGIAHRKHSEVVRAIAIFDNQHRVFVNSSFQRNFNQLRLPPGSAIPAFTEIEHASNGDVLLRTPIYQESNLLGLRADEQAPILGYVVVQLNTDHAKVQQYKAASYAIAIVVLGAIINLFFAFRLVKQVTEPIGEMVDAVDQIRKGRLDTRVGGPKMGELDALRLGINAMAKSLQESQQELQNSVEQATADLRETLEQIEIQNIKLDMANKRAQEAARTKSDFLANMSHELRTPLNAVIGFTKQLAKTGLSSHQRDYLSTIERSAHNLLNIINDVLDFSKLEAGKLKLEQMPFRLRDTLFEVATLLAPDAHDKRLEFAVMVANDVPDYLIGDAFRIKQVLTNLLGNAVKFTERGYVQVQVLLVADHGERVDIKVSVKDTGIGISREQQQSLFSAFSQGDSSITRRYGGTGLGLVISQQLVRQMGGNMTLDSEQGRGSTFHFSLNCAKSPLPLGEPLPLELLRQRSLLLYEPLPVSRRAIAEPLTAWGVQVTSCSEPIEWRGYLDRGQRVDVVLLSCAAASNDMPRLKALIEEARHISERVVVICNLNDPLLHEQIRDCGADECFVKPLPFQRLVQAILPHSQPQPAGPALIAPADSRINARVLAVDDNPANLKLLEALLKDMVAEVVCCRDGQEAVLAAQKSHYDLILMDIQMPKLDGVSATAQIRRTLMNRATPVVAVTAHALPGEREKLLGQGLDDYLTKPVDEAALANLMRRWLKTQAEPLSNDLAEQQEAVVVTLPGSGSIDWALALKRSGNKQALAEEMMQMLIDSLPEAARNIEAAYHGGEREALRQHVHKLNGGCCYTGAPRLQQLAHTIETGLKQELPLADIEPEVLELLDEMDNLRNAWQEMVEASDSQR